MSNSIFDRVPDELVAKIMCFLLDDTKSFICFSLINKRMKRISDTLTIWSEWTQHRPTCFAISDEEDDDLKHYYDAIDCNQHGTCLDCSIQYGFKCEMERCTSSPRGKWSKQIPPLMIYGPDPEIVALRPENRTRRQNSTTYPHKCFYHRLYCMFKSKYITFSSLKFEFECGFLFDRGCIDASRFYDRIEKPLFDFKIRALVELELYRCYITIDWLNTTLRELTHVVYLTLDEVSYEEPYLLAESKHHVARKLNRLKISHDRTVKMNDLVFMYFLENFPAIELDLTGSKIEHKTRLINRFYPNFSSMMDTSHLTSRACEMIFTLPFIHIYLRRYQSITKHLIVNRSNFSIEPLKRLILDADLKHLIITAKNCLELGRQEQTRFLEAVDECDAARVTF